VVGAQLMFLDATPPADPLSANGLGPGVGER
jgi:hypothetical protein